MAALTSLKAIQCNPVLGKYYSDIKINYDILTSRTEYYNWNPDDDLYYIFSIKLDDTVERITCSGGYEGRFLEYDEAKINMEKICTYLLKDVSKEDLLQLSTSCDIYFLKKAAKDLLQKQTI
jgi:hypothetical protein